MIQAAAEYVSESGTAFPPRKILLEMELWQAAAEIRASSAKACKEMPRKNSKKLYYI